MKSNSCNYLYYCKVPHNIGHFLHEEIPKILNFLRDKSNENFNFILKNKSEWVEGVVSILVSYYGHTYIKEISKDIELTKFPNEYNTKINRADININDIKMIRNIIFNKYNIPMEIYNKNKVLYTRQDALRRRMINFELIEHLFDMVIHNLSISFDEQIKLFSNMSHFVSLEGAHMTNVILMKQSTKILSIQVSRKNSWQEQFGTHKLVNEFNIDLVMSMTCMEYATIVAVS